MEAAAVLASDRAAHARDPKGGQERAALDFAGASYAANDRDATRDCSAAVDGLLASVRTAGRTALAATAQLGVVEAADFAGKVEQASRAVEYLQIVAAAAVERSRRQAGGQSAAPSVAGFGTDSGANSAPGWLTGWNTAPSDAAAIQPATAPLTVPLSAAVSPEPAVLSPVPDLDPGAAAPPEVIAVRACLDDGYRTATEFLRARLRISAAEARRRLALAEDLLPRTGMVGQLLAPAKQELAAEVASGAIASRAASVITQALDRVRPVCSPEAAGGMEHALTRTALEADQDFLCRVARHWTDAVDQDGSEPSEAELRVRQGAFIRRSRRGLQHLEIYATPEQFEHLMTVMNTGTNPRAAARSGVVGQAATGAADGPGAAGAADGPGAAGGGQDRLLDTRSRQQQLLDGLVGACKAALTSGALPATGGLRPQVMVTIGYRDLLERIGSGRAGAGTGNLMFTGPVTASTVRRIACDADIIPVLLGGEGRVLDIGRSSRIFPPHIRKALTARDQGCAFPECSIPAAWCEAHHISYWSRGGTTGTDNGALLCTYHHHLIHREEWTIELRSGVPWFLPPPHVDPRRTPRRNRFFRLD